MSKYLLAAMAVVCLFVYPFKAASNQDVAKYLMLEKANQVLMLTPPSRHDTGGTGFSVRTLLGKVVTITNAHICRLQENGMLSARIPGTERWVSIKVMEISKTTDLCVAEAVPGATGLSLAPEVVQFSAVYALGHPYLNSARVSEGNLLARETIELGEEESDAGACTERGGAVKNFVTPFGDMQYCIESVDSYPVTALIYPGNSGSPAMNSLGEVVGVVFAGDARTNTGFIIPRDVLQKFLSLY